VTHTHWRLRRAAVRLGAERIAVEQLLQAHGAGSQGALLMLLAAPCVLPVPGVGSVLGLGIAMLAWTMWCGRDLQTLPERVSRLTMPRIWARRVLALLARVHALAAAVARPRWEGVIRTGSRSWIPAMVAWLAFLIILPLPLGNVLPALALMLLGVGLLARDGTWVTASAAVAAVATAYPAALVMAGAAWGGEALSRLLPALGS
jgi:hypothetical protein